MGRPADRGLLTPTFQPTDQQVLSLLNTIYFKDEWYDRFQSKNTQSDTFTKADSSQVTCDFMNGRTGPWLFPGQELYPR